MRIQCQRHRLSTDYVVPDAFLPVLSLVLQHQSVMFESSLVVPVPGVGLVSSASA
jgi:hypothetical protein